MRYRRKRGGSRLAAATIGTTVTLSRLFVGLAASTAQTGQTGLTSYGRVGLNFMIN